MNVRAIARITLIVPLFLLLLSLLYLFLLSPSPLRRLQMVCLRCSILSLTQRISKVFLRPIDSNLIQLPVSHFIFSPQAVSSGGTISNREIIISKIAVRIKMCVFFLDTRPKSEIIKQPVRWREKRRKNLCRCIFRRLFKNDCL